MEEILKSALEKWGFQVQLEMLQEESTELALAARRFIRKRDDQTKNNLAEEIADVQILIEQVKIMFPDIISQIDSVRKFKLKRLKKRIDNNKFED